jgi:hypothetical protein
MRLLRECREREAKKGNKQRLVHDVHRLPITVAGEEIYERVQQEKARQAG